MAKVSAGLLLYRSGPRGHRGLAGCIRAGRCYRKRDAGAWTIPKGEVEGEEDMIERAKIEFKEEMGVEAPAGPVGWNWGRSSKRAAR